MVQEDRKMSEIGKCDVKFTKKIKLDAVALSTKHPEGRVKLLFYEFERTQVYIPRPVRDTQ